MTNKELKMWLKRCAANDSSCAGCPFEANSLCFDEIKLAALALIKKQEKDIKQLKTECALLDDELRNARQETINVLNELKDKMFEREYMGVKYKERIFYESDIDELIKELIANAED